MNDRASTWVLWVGVLGLALTDWMVGGSIAQDAGRPANAAVPTRAPLGADLTESLAQPVTIDGVRLELEASASGAHALKATNESAAPKRLALSVECWDTVGSPMSRMGPMPRQVGSVHVDLVLAAHQTVTRALALVLPAPPRLPAAASADTNAAGLGGMGWIATRDFRIGVAGGAGDAQAPALGQLAAREPAAAAKTEHAAEPEQQHAATGHAQPR